MELNFRKWEYTDPKQDFHVGNESSQTSKTTYNSYHKKINELRIQLDGKVLD